MLVTLIGVTIAAWALTLYQSVSMDVPMGVAMRGGMATQGMTGMAMDGMSVADWHLRGLAVFVALWTVMMVAMMLPGATPMILIFAYAQARRDQARPDPDFDSIHRLRLSHTYWAAAGVLVYVCCPVQRRLCSVAFCSSTGRFGPACARSDAASSQGYISSRR